MSDGYELTHDLNPLRIDQIQLFQTKDNCLTCLIKINGNANSEFKLDLNQYIGNVENSKIKIELEKTTLIIGDKETSTIEFKISG